MKTIVHVNQHVIKANRKHGTDEPCLTVKTYKDNRYGHEAVILDEQTGTHEIARVVYRPHDPLSCGAHCWIETQNRVIVIQREVSDEEEEYDCSEHDGSVCEGRAASG
jgi:hypothetical protein|tara:strand:+ start:6958 stop:7281 length:324 start_codon:yes stop_codon:yes gene_type:complete